MPHVFILLFSLFSLVVKIVKFYPPRFCSSNHVIVCSPTCYPMKNNRSYTLHLKELNISFTDSWDETWIMYNIIDDFISLYKNPF